MHTDLTTAQILELTEIVTEIPAKRTATKAKAFSRLMNALDDKGLSPDAVAAEPFDTIKAMLLGKPAADEEPLPESDLAERASKVDPGGPGIDRLRNNPRFAEIKAQTIHEAEGVLTGEDRVSKSGKKAIETAAKRAETAAAKVQPEAEAPAPAPAATRGRRSKFGEDDLIAVIGDNPKRPGTKAHAIFACYGSGTKVSAFIACVVKAGYSEADAWSNLAWDSRKGFISITAAKA